MIVDAEDVDRVSKFKWHTYVNHGNTYAKKSHPTMTLHKFILNAPDGSVIDHINGNGLDNRKENLRIVSHRVNRQNSKKHRDGHPLGCYFHKSHNKWMARIKVNGVGHFLGYYNTPEEASHVYKLACWLYGVDVE